MNTSRTVKKALFYALIPSTAIVLAGCMAAALVAGGAAAGVGTAAYVGGDLEAVTDQNVETLHKACLAALEEMNIPVISSERDVLEGKIIARGVDDKKISIKMKYREPQLTKLWIRVGVFGDKDKSQAIYDHIRKHLIEIASQNP
ncbi:MAG TPA: DUF3568 family protein [Phycisphaerales bacterium]|nr:DUF3568 family protein [Phycisphaerales bacterium]